MADRESIQQRIDALAALERARELRDQGDYKGARAALRACLSVLPDHPDALELKQELGEPADDHERETFQVSDWIAEEEARASGEPTDQDDLRHLLRKAIAEQNHEQIISLGEALLTLSGPDSQVYHEQVAASAEHLVEANDPDRLDIALGWADTWWRVCHDPRAKDYARALKGRIATVSHHEQQVRDALIRGNLSNLMRAIHELTSSRDRMESTEDILEAAQARLGDMRSDIAATRQALEDAIPERINEARRLLEELTAIDANPADERRLAEMRERERAVAEIHRQVEEAIERGHYAPLARGCARLRDSGDQLTTSRELLGRAEVALTRLQAERERNIQAFEGGLQHDLEQAVVALTALCRVDPDHEHCAQLHRLEQRLREVEQQHQDLEHRLSDKDLRGVATALERVRQRSDRLSVTPKLITRAERYIDEVSRRERRQRNLVISVTSGSLIALAIPLVLWLVDRSAWHQALAVDQPRDRLAAIAAYRERPLSLFYDRSAELEHRRLVARLEDQAWTSAVGVADPVERIAALERYAAAHSGSGHAAKVAGAIAEAEREIDRRAFLAARNETDPATRASALEAFIQDARTDAYQRAADEAIAAARAELDQARWREALAANEHDERLARLRAYLDSGGSHAPEAEAMIAELERSGAADRLAAADHADWARVAAATTATDQLAAVEDYLAEAANIRHRPEAVAERERLRRAVDDAAWKAASAAEGEPGERLQRLRAYLARTAPPPRHELEAEQMIAAITRERERAAWMIASAPGPTAARVQRLRDYLEDHAASGYAKDARILLGQLEDQVDYAVYAKAMGTLAPGQRVLALQAYLSGGTSQANAERAKREIRRLLAEISTYAPADLALEPVPLLAQLDPALLARMPREAQLRLPVETLRRLAPEAQSRLPLRAFAGLPPSELVTVPRYPAWCSRAGVDTHGSWAEIDLRGRDTMRLRLLPPAEIDGRRVGPVWIAESETTQSQWRAIAGGHPSRQRGDDLPVHRLTLREAQRYAQRLADLLEIEHDDPHAPRLPTSDEYHLWTSTAASGASETFPEASAPGPEQLAAIAWIDRGEQGLGPATGREPDAWGIYGTFGNVAEWVVDTEAARALGGHFASAPDSVVPPPTLGTAPDERDPHVGMRIVISERWEAGP